MARLLLCLLGLSLGMPALAEGYCSDCGKPRGKQRYCVHCGSPGYNPLETCHNCRENLHETMRFCPRCGHRVRRNPLGKLAVGQTWLLKSTTEIETVMVDYYRCRVVDVTAGVCSYVVQREAEGGKTLGAAVLMSFSIESDQGVVVGEETLEAVGFEFACVVRQQGGLQRWLLREYPIIVLRSEFDDGKTRQHVELIEIELNIAEETEPE